MTAPSDRECVGRGVRASERVRATGPLLSLYGSSIGLDCCDNSFACDADSSAKKKEKQNRKESSTLPSTSHIPQFSFAPRTLAASRPPTPHVSKALIHHRIGYMWSRGNVVVGPASCVSPCRPVLAHILRPSASSPILHTQYLARHHASGPFTASSTE